MDIEQKRMQAKRLLAKRKLESTQQVETPVVERPISEPAPVQPSVSNTEVIGESVSREAPANILGAPMDLVNLLTNTVKSGAQVLSGRGNEPFQSVPSVGGSDFFRENLFSEVADREDYSSGQKYLGNAVTMGTEALTGGVGLASKAGKVDEITDTTGILADAIEPYITRPVAQTAQDVAGGVGAGTALTAAEESDAGPIATLLATILGGAGSTGGAKVVERGARRRHANKEIKIDGADGEVRRQAVEDARQISDEFVTDRPQAISNINESLADADELGLADPTLGPASGDVGLSMLEVRQRNKQPQPFMERDQEIRTGVADKFNEFRNEDADVTAPQRAASGVIDDKLTASQGEIDALRSKELETEQSVRDLDRKGEELTSEISSRRGSEGRASAQLNDQIGPDGALGERTKLKNEAFEKAADGALVDAKSLLKTVEDINSSKSTLTLGDNKIPEDLINSIKKFIPEDGSLEGPGSTAGKIPADDVLKLRRDLSSEIEKARAAKDFAKADTYRELKDAINETINYDPAFKDANTNYKENYAPFFAEGYGKKYRDTVQKGDGTGSADPDKMASFFLNKTSSAAEDLARMRDIAPDTNAFDEAVELYFDATLARKGDITPKTVRNFIADNSDVLPDDLKKKYETTAASIVKNTQEKDATFKNLKKLKDDVRTAESNMSKQERALNSGPLGRIAKYDSDKYVGDVMGAKDRNSQIDSIIADIGDDKEAMDGFKEATVRWLQGKVKGTAASHTSLDDVDVTGRPVTYSKLTKTLDDNREALSKVFSPEEMNTLTRIHKVMAKQGNLSRRANTGSDSIEKLKLEENMVMDIVEAGVKLKFGMIRGGGLFRTINKARSAMFGPSGRVTRADDLLSQMAFNPKVAKHILEVTPLKLENGKWVSELNALMATQEALSDEDENPDN